MKKIILGNVFVIALLLSGCTTYQYSARQTNVNRQAISMSPTIVDVKPDYTKRIEAATSGWCFTKDEAINECRYTAITTNNIDVIVDPIFKVKKRPIALRRYKATVTGYAGYYVNSRTLYEDMKTMREFSREEIEKYLILHNPEVLRYMNTQGDVVNIYHNNGDAGKESVKKTSSAGKTQTVAEKEQTTTEKPTTTAKQTTTKKKTSKSKSSKSKSKK